MEIIGFRSGATDVTRKRSALLSFGDGASGTGGADGAAATLEVSVAGAD